MSGTEEQVQNGLGIKIKFHEVSFGCVKKKTWINDWYLNEIKSFLDIYTKTGAI